ncbi:MAG: histidine phosphatase family protein [Ilumatobacter sp.]|nr:histidine phosphatase family protein [Ilumatobacter sp.]
MSVDGDASRPTRLVLIRHGESDVTVRRVIGGPRTCSGLSDLGRRQARQLADRLAETGELADATVLYSSEYPRAVETAELIAPALDLPVERDRRLGEHDPGPDCDGMSFEAFVDRYGMPDWTSDLHGVSFPGGETVAEFQFRVGKALSNVVAEHPGATVVIVCHGGVVDVAFRTLLRIPPSGGFFLHTSNTSLSEFVRAEPGRWRLVRYNDAAHLAGLPAETPRA